MSTSLRVRLPLLLLGFVVFAATLTYFAALPPAYRAIERKAVDELREQMDLAQAGLDALLRHGNLGDVRNYLGSFLSDNDIVNILLLDGSGRVLIDPQRVKEGSTADAVLPPDLRGRLETLARSRGGLVELRADHAVAFAVYPVVLQAREFGLRPKSLGFIYVEHDLNASKRAQRIDTLSMLGSFMFIMGVLTLLLGVILNREVTLRVKHLLEVARRVIAGDLDARADLHGSREFSELAQTLNTMTATLVRQQLQLRERESRLRLSHEFSGTGAFEWNVEDDHVYGPRAFWARVGTPPPIVNDFASALALVYPADQALTMRAFQDCAHAGSTLDVHFRCVDNGGHMHWIHMIGDAERRADGSARRVVALARDETDQIEAQARLAESLRELEYQKYALDQHAIVAITDARGIITYVNENFCVASGYARDELLGRSHAMLRSGEHDGAFYEDMWRTIRRGKVWRARIKNRRKDGAIYWVDTTIVPHPGSDGRPDGFISIRTDITARVAAENEREVLRRQLNQTQKVEAIGLLSGGIAHDFNNILAAILGHAELAQRRYGAREGSEKLSVHLQEVTTAAERGRDLIQRILTFSRGSPEQPRPLALGAIATDVIKMLRPVLPSTIEVRTDIADDLPLVLLSPIQGQQVIMNLCINARDAIGESGAIALGIERAARHGKCAACGGEYAGDHLVLAVEDTGPGIPADVVDRIFDPFFTTKPTGSGSGLGLSVVHGIVHQVGGHIAVGRSAQGGARFEILLSPCPEATVTPVARVRELRRPGPASPAPTETNTCLNLG